MPKIREKKTMANLVYYYKFADLTAPDELDAWFANFLSSADALVHFGIVKLSNLHTTNSEEGGPEELEIHQVRQSLLQAMRNAHANQLSVSFTYQNAPMVMGLTLGQWVVSLVASRSDGDKLAELSGLLKLDQA